MERSPNVQKIQGVIKHYEWGGKTFLPRLLHLPNPDGKPFAEYWLTAPSPSSFLLKVLDVEKMLSIQVHPSREAAQQKFREENERGIPLDAPHRNYKDDNHKPELLSPLSTFYLLHGFKAQAALVDTLQQVPELRFLETVFADGDYRALYASVMTMDQHDVNSHLAPLLDRIVPAYHAGRLERSAADFWAARAATSFGSRDVIDRGIFSIYFFNLVKLRAGEALFQDAGLPHAYLEGQTVEIMANSDNVLRGGLTPKHIDVPELLEHVRYQPTVPQIIAATDAGGEQIFRTPITDFQLSRLRLKKNESFTTQAQHPEIYFVYTGEVRAGVESFGAGESFLLNAGAIAELSALDESVLYRATQPNGA